MQTVAIVIGTAVSIFVSSLIGIHWMVEATTATMRQELSHLVQEVREITTEFKAHNEYEKLQQETIAKHETRITVLEKEVFD